MAHKADSIKEPSYNTLANLAEILGATIYNSPALASTNKLDEAVKPDEAKLELGIITDYYGLGSGRGPQPEYKVKLNSGAVVDARSISGEMYYNGYVVAVVLDQGGTYTIISGGDEKYQCNAKNSMGQFASQFDFYVTDANANPKGNYTFNVVDTQKLLDMIGDLRVAIATLIDYFVEHTHDVAQGKTSQPIYVVTPPKQQPTAKLKENIVNAENKLLNTKSDKFQINY